MVILYCIIAYLAVSATFISIQVHNAQSIDADENEIRGPGLSAVEFPEQTDIIAKDQPQYRPLPAFLADGEEGDVITCWRLTLLDRIAILFTGKIWCSVWTFRKPYPPMYLTVRKKDVLRRVRQTV